MRQKDRDLRQRRQRRRERLRERRRQARLAGGLPATPPPPAADKHARTE
jgi:hypothetical protein